LTHYFFITVLFFITFAAFLFAGVEIGFALPYNIESLPAEDFSVIF